SFAYASAGHPAGYILDPAGTIQATLKRTGIPLGMSPETTYTTAPELSLAPGSLILLLTDGIEETAAPDGTLFGLERILSVVREKRANRAREIVDALYGAVRAFAAGSPQTDDITTIVVKCDA